MKDGQTVTIGDVTFRLVTRDIPFWDDHMNCYLYTCTASIVDFYQVIQRYPSMRTSILFCHRRSPQAAMNDLMEGLRNELAFHQEKTGRR